MELTKPEFDGYVEGFKNGNETVDLAFRHAMIGDEEESRVAENYTANGDAYIAEFPEAIRDQVKPLIEAICGYYGQPAAFDFPSDDLNTTCDKLVKLLEPFISNKALWDKDQGLWENILFADDYATVVEEYHAANG